MVTCHKISKYVSPHRHSSSLVSAGSAVQAGCLLALHSVKAKVMLHSVRWQDCSLAILRDLMPHNQQKKKKKRSPSWSNCFQLSRGNSVVVIQILGKKNSLKPKAFIL